jgi:hypothetical protein
MIQGAVTGVFFLQGVKASTVITTQLLAEAFLAGLALKGFSEAVATIRPETEQLGIVNANFS